MQTHYNILKTIFHVIITKVIPQYLFHFYVKIMKNIKRERQGEKKKDEYVLIKNKEYIKQISW